MGCTYRAGGLLCLHILTDVGITESGVASANRGKDGEELADVIDRPPRAAVHRVQRTTHVLAEMPVTHTHIKWLCLFRYMFRYFSMLSHVYHINARNHGSCMAPPGSTAVHLPA